MAVRWRQGMDIHGNVDNTMWLVLSWSIRCPGVVPTPEGEWAIYPPVEHVRNAWHSEQLPLGAKLALCGPARFPTQKSAMAACILIYGS